MLEDGNINPWNMVHIDTDPLAFLPSNCPSIVAATDQEFKEAWSTTQLLIPMRYQPKLRPFNTRDISDGTIVAVSGSGDFIFSDSSELAQINEAPHTLPITRQAELKAKFFLRSDHSLGSDWLLVSRRAEKRKTIDSGPSLHIIVPTLQCAHSCQYCQVSRALDSQTHVMSMENLDKACDTIFQSKSPSLTVEFQGGDPLLRFDMVEYAIRRIATRNTTEARRIRFVVATTMHQLTEEMCHFFRAFNVYISTSMDGPITLHNKNRPIPTRDAYDRTLAGLHMARALIGEDSVSALMTTTKASLAYPESIVDEYVRLGFREIFIRPLSAYGFAKRNQPLLGYTTPEFISFYQRALDRVLYWNTQGVALREIYTAILLNKILSDFDGGYVDLQSPTGAGLATLIYNYDGFVYPSDESRMLAETGDTGLRLGAIGESIDFLLSSPLQKSLIAASLVDENDDCKICAYSMYCAPNPVDAYAQHGSPATKPRITEHCQRHLGLFDVLFSRIQCADEETLNIFHDWATPVELLECAA